MQISGTFRDRWGVRGFTFAVFSAFLRQSARLRLPDVVPPDAFRLELSQKAGVLPESQPHQNAVATIT
jgi:hypothetical protein